MKKKILSLCLVFALALTAIGGTLAYFTDTDAATNTFVAGGVSIELIEKERDYNEDGTVKDELVDFEQKKTLMPLVGSAQGEKDKHGLPTAENYVDKVVTIKNDGKSPAYIRAYFAIPSDLDDGYETFNAGMNILHFNFGNKVANGATTTTFGHEWLWKTDAGNWNYFETTIDKVAYNVYFADYYQPVAAEATTEQLIQGVYLDSSFNQNDDSSYVCFGKTVAMSTVDMNSVSCPVFAIACQADGFDTADAAFNKAFGEKYNPWGGTVSNWQN